MPETVAPVWVEAAPVRPRGPRERLRLDRALDRSSAAIWWQRHDRQSR
jgi:hypothetical protein